MKPGELTHYLSTILFFIFIATFGSKLIAQGAESAAELKAKYFNVRAFHKGRAVFHGKNCLWGYLDENYEEVIPATFDYAFDFFEELARVKLQKGEAFIDKAGNLQTVVARDVISTRRGNYILLTTEDPERAVLYDIVNDRRLTDVNTFNQIEALEDDFFKYRIGVRWGLMNSNGETITAARYHEISRNNHKKSNYYAVQIDNRCGVIDRWGKEIIPLKYREAKHLENTSFFALQDPKTEKWGMLNAQNEIILPFRYSTSAINLMVISKDLFFIKEEDKIVAYNHIGQQLKRYELNAEIYSIGDVAVLLQNGYRYLLGQTISNAFFDIIPLGDSLLLVQVENDYGICNKAGKIIQKTEFTSIFRINTAPTLQVNIYVAKNKSGLQLLNAKGERLLTTYFEEWKYLNDSLYTFYNKDFNIVYDIKHEKIVFTGTWKELRVVKADLWATRSDSNWTIFNLSDPRIHIDCDDFFTVIAHLKKHKNSVSTLFIKRGEKYFGVESDYKTLYPIAFLPHSVNYIDGELYFSVRKNNEMYNLIRKSDNKELFEQDYAFLRFHREDLLEAENDEGLKGLINLRGNTIIPFNYTRLTVKDSSVYGYRYIRNETVDYYNSKNELISLPEGYTWRDNYGERPLFDLFVVKKDGLYGCVNSNGKIIIPAVYESIYFHKEGVIEAKKHLFFDYFSLNGEWIECYRRKSTRF